jgi:hypothetical protein
LAFSAVSEALARLACDARAPSTAIGTAPPDDSRPGMGGLAVPAAPSGLVTLMEEERRSTGTPALPERGGSVT